jgi:hypothetical protein
VPAFPAEKFFKEVWLTIKELRDPRIIACTFHPLLNRGSLGYHLQGRFKPLAYSPGCFLWSQSLFIPSWPSTYLALHFSVRVRGLTSLVTPVLTMLTLFLVGSVLDMKRLCVRYKILYTWLFLQTISIASTIWLIIVLYHQQSNPTVSYDWLSPGFAPAWVPYLMSYSASWTCYGYYCEYRRGLKIGHDPNGR